MTNETRTDLKCLAAIYRIMDGLTCDEDRQLCAQIMLEAPRDRKEVVAFAAEAGRRWIERCERPEFLRQTVRARFGQQPGACDPCPTPCPVEVDGETAGCDADDCDCPDKAVTVDRSRLEK